MPIWSCFLCSRTSGDIIPWSPCTNHHSIHNSATGGGSGQRQVGDKDAKAFLPKLRVPWNTHPGQGPWLAGLTVISLPTKLSASFLKNNFIVFFMLYKLCIFLQKDIKWKWKITSQFHCQGNLSNSQCLHQGLFWMFYTFFFLSILRIKCRALHMLGKCSPTPALLFVFCFWDRILLTLPKMALN
jgi:hypothetical protein